MSRKSQETIGPNVDIPATTESNSFQDCFSHRSVLEERYLFAKTYDPRASIPHRSFQASQSHICGELDCAIGVSFPQVSNAHHRFQLIAAHQPLAQSALEA